MSLQDLNRRHLKLIGIYSTRYAIRGGAGLIFFLVVLLAGLAVAQLVIAPIETGQVQIEEEFGQKMAKEEVARGLMLIAEPYVSWAIGEEEELTALKEIERGWEKDRYPWAAFLLRDRPALLSAVLLVLLFAMPFLTVLGSFNQYSGDVGSRGIRYQLLRTERANIYFGRFLGSILYTAITLAILIGTIVTYMGLKLEFYDWPGLLGWGLRGWLALTILSVPYTAFCGWISGGVDSPMLALVLCILGVVGVPVFASIAGRQWEHAQYIKYALPWGVQNDLLHFSAGNVVIALLACLGYTALFLAVGYRHFAKRDL